MARSQARRWWVLCGVCSVGEKNLKAATRHFPFHNVGVTVRACGQGRVFSDSRPNWLHHSEMSLHAIRRQVLAACFSTQRPRPCGELDIIHGRAWAIVRGSPVLPSQLRYWSGTTRPGALASSVSKVEYLTYPPDALLA
jgi:hypothetical protein